MWLDGEVTLECPDQAYPAKISTYRWNGWAMPKFTAETMIRIVEDFHAEHVKMAEAGMEDCAVDVLWNGTTVIVRNYAYPDEETEAPYSVDELEPDDDGYYHFGGGYFTWQVVEEDWPQAAEVVERLRESSALREQAYAVHAEHDYSAKQAAVEAYESAVARAGVPAGHLREVAGDLYVTWRESFTPEGMTG